MKFWERDRLSWRNSWRNSSQRESARSPYVHRASSNKSSRFQAQIDARNENVTPRCRSGPLIPRGRRGSSSLRARSRENARAKWHAKISRSPFSAYLAAIAEFRKGPRAPARLHGTTMGLSWSAATRARMIPRDICIQSRDGGRRRFRNPRKAADRLASRLPSLLPCRGQCVAFLQRVLFSLPLSSASSEIPGSFLRSNVDVGTPGTRVKRISANSRENSPDGGASSGERKLVTWSAMPGERCRTLENPASTAEANRWAVPAFYGQWRITSMSCRGQQVWYRGAASGAYLLARCELPLDR